MNQSAGDPLHYGDSKAIAHLPVPLRIRLAIGPVVGESLEAFAFQRRQPADHGRVSYATRLPIGRADSLLDVLTGAEIACDGQGGDNHGIAGIAVRALAVTRRERRRYGYQVQAILLPSA
jgi:hypothetical protein